jgi:uncharacterized membrane-anchored protein
MVTGTTRSGFSFEVAEDIANDMELFEALCDLDDGDATAVVPVCRKVLGAQKKALYEHLRDENGRVPIDKVAEEIADILAAVKEGKKS